MATDNCFVGDLRPEWQMGLYKEAEIVLPEWYVSFNFIGIYIIFLP